jgi:hypothetical protein
MFQYLQALGLLAGYVATMLALSGWAWFTRYFKELGINIDALNYDVSITRIDYYMRPGAEAVRRLIVGDFSPEIEEIFTQNRLYITIFSLSILVMIYLYVQVRTYNRRILEDPKYVLGFNFIYVSAFTGLIAILGVLAVKAGEWTAADNAKRLLSEKLPYVEISFKSNSKNPANEALNGKNLKKIFMDRSNIYVYAETEAKEGLPPIYVISLSEVSQIRLLH